jgi:hypothetical protein
MPYGDEAHMGKRGPSAFRKLDVSRAIRSAREGGVEPAVIEVIGKDGVTIRIYGDRAAQTATSEVMTTKEWDAEIEKLKKTK